MCFNISDDLFEKEIGKRLLEYFRSDELSCQVVQDRCIGYLYFLSRLHDATHGKKLTDKEFAQCWDATVDACRKKGVALFLSQE